MLQISPAVRAAIIARPETFLSAYNALGGGGNSAESVIRAQLGAPFASLNSAGCIATFASAVAFDIAPNGADTLDPMSATLQQLLNSPALTYSHFCKLNALLALLGSPRLIPPDTGTTASLHFLVWLADAPFGIGAHAQLILANVLNGAYLLLDPTYACALCIPFGGARPQAGTSVVENAAQMLQTPIASANLALLDPAGTAAVPQLPVALTNGALGPQYLDLDALNGSPGWDAHIARAFANMG
jgi:hypothetical protein